MRGTKAFILLAIDKPLGLFRWPLRLVQTEFPTDPFDEPQLVIAIQNLKILWQARFLPMGL